MEVKIDLKKRVFNDVYYPLLECQTRYLVMFGGGGSGKSVFAAQRYIYKLLKQKRCNLLCVRAVGNTLRDSVFAELRKVIRAWKLENLFKVNVSDMRITCVTGNEVLFRGLDDVEKLKSVTFVNGELTDVWIEETSEVAEEDFNQLNIRLRGGSTQKQIVITFNPIDVNHWLKKRFFDRKEDNATILHTTYKDNRFLDDEYKRLLESYKDTDPYYYDVYCLGMWGVYGKTIFNASAVNEQIAKDIKPIKRGNFVKQSDGKFVFMPDENGDIRIYEDVKVRYPYVVGCDTAGEGSDYAVAQVLDNTTGRLVATMRSQSDEDIYAEQFFALGRYYNDALIAVEANFSTYPVKKLQEWKYPKQYVREVEDTITHKVQLSYGFKTTALTRPIIISNLIAIARDGMESIVDKDTLFEMLTFVRNSKGRPEAQAGAHDDAIMALAIAYHVRDKQSNRVKELPPPERHYNFESERPKGNPLGQGVTIKVV